MIRQQSKFVNHVECVYLWVIVCVCSLSGQQASETLFKKVVTFTHTNVGTLYKQTDTYAQSGSFVSSRRLLFSCPLFLNVYFRCSRGDTDSVFICCCPHSEVQGADGERKSVHVYVQMPACVNITMYHPEYPSFNA